jgi:T5orf172 domain
MNTEEALLSKKTKFDEVAYTVTLATGVVRYLKVEKFLSEDVERLIDILYRLSAEPQIKIPRSDFTRVGDVNGLSIGEVDGLLLNETWQNRIRLHHKLGRLYCERGMPSCVYCCFHSQLGLKTFECDACLEAWVGEAWWDDDVTDSFLGSPIHMVLPTSDPCSRRLRCVFRKTPLVLAQLKVLDAEAQRQREAEEARRVSVDLDRLRKSGFHTFLYVMEDTRNGHFKIGHSKTPGKRERTLQSEVPSVTLRFSLPADEEHEKQLHEHFDNKNLRGEWFSLTAEELLWMISFLKANGDATRASVDYEWLGKLYFQAGAKPGEA